MPEVAQLPVVVGLGLVDPELINPVLGGRCRFVPEPTDADLVQAQGAIARDGKASLTKPVPGSSGNGQGGDLDSDNLLPLFKTILETIPAPSFTEGAPLQAHVTNLDASNFLGRIALCRGRGAMPVLEAKYASVDTGETLAPSFPVSSNTRRAISAQLTGSPPLLTL